MQTDEEARRAEEARQRSIAKHAEAAKAWWDSGRTYYIVKLTFGRAVAGISEYREEGGDDVSGILQQIEAVGWHLYDIGYVFQPFGSAHALTTSADMSGHILGIYTFSREHQGFERLL